MVQILNISRVRENLSSLVQQVAQTKQPLVIVRDSIPSVIMYPYSPNTSKKSYKETLLSITGDWFDAKEYKKIRKDVEEKIQSNKI